MKTLDITGITWAGSDIPKDVIHIHAVEEITLENSSPTVGDSSGPTPVGEVTIIIPKMLLKPLGITYPNTVNGISKTMDDVIEEQQNE